MNNKFTSMAFAVVFLISGMDSPAFAAADLKTKIDESTIFLNEFLKDERWKGVRNLLGAAKGLIVATNIKKTALVLGYESGSGVLLSRHGDQCSDPISIEVQATSVAFQAGIQDADLVFVILTRSALDEFIDGVFKFGGSGGFAIGSWGAGARASGSLGGGVEVLTISVSSGLFLGGGLEGISISADLESIEKIYGTEAKDVLSKTGGEFKGAEELRALLNKAVRASWDQ